MKTSKSVSELKSFPLQDLVEMAKYKNADILSLLKSAYIRGYAEDVSVTKESIKKLL